MPLHALPIRGGQPEANVPMDRARRLPKRARSVTRFAPGCRSKTSLRSARDLGSAARLLAVHWPAHLERFVAAAGDATEELAVPQATTELEPAIALASEYGVEILDPPGLRLRPRGTRRSRPPGST